MLARILLSILLCGFVGCVSNSRAPTDTHGAYSPHASYTVKRGDTLYSIAFRSGMDFRKVADANGIFAPYTIYPGQLIFLTEQNPARPISISPAVAESGSASPSISAPTPAPRPVPVPVPVPAPAHGSSTVYAPAPAPAPVPVPVPVPVPGRQDPNVYTPPHANPVFPAVSVTESIPASAPVAVPAAAPEPAPELVPAPASSVGVPEVDKPLPTDTFVSGPVKVWLWPAVGPLTRGYSESVHKGIDIGGARGDPIVAVAAGKVVYSGTGIVGFGELLIIKHNEEYLSAYGHNDRLLVTEGQTVTAGQVIAEKGSSGTDTVKLHFEIRMEGKPIDPQRVLPKR